MRLLIVGDQQESGKIRHLAHEVGGFEEISCADTEEGALDIFYAQPFDMVICDIHLSPGHKGEGFRLMRMFREVRLDCYVICFTGESNEVCAEAMEDSGAEMVVSTSWDLDGCVGLLRNFIEIGQIIAQRRKMKAESL